MTAGETRVAQGERRRPAVLARLKGWKPEDANARFSELVRLAREQAPQRVTVYRARTRSSCCRRPTTPASRQPPSSPACTLYFPDSR